MYLKNEVAYQDREGTCRIEETPVALAESYSENECDAIYVGLLSENDAEHEKDLDVLREICQNTAVPVIGSGHIFRMEDVKKLLYAGCQQVMLDYADPVQLELTKEVSLKELVESGIQIQMNYGAEQYYFATRYIANLEMHTLIRIFCFWNRKRSC